MRFPVTSQMMMKKRNESMEILLEKKTRKMLPKPLSSQAVKFFSSFLCPLVALLFRPCE